MPSRCLARGGPCFTGGGGPTSGDPMCPPAFATFFAGTALLGDFLAPASAGRGSLLEPAGRPPLVGFANAGQSTALFGTPSCPTVSQMEPEVFGKAISTRASAGTVEEATAVGLSRASKVAGTDTKMVLLRLKFLKHCLIKSQIVGVYPLRIKGHVDGSYHMSCSGICQCHNLCTPSSMAGKLVK